MGFWLGVLMLGALVLAGCTQPQDASPSASATAGPQGSGSYSGELGSVDAAGADFQQFEAWSGELESTGDVDASDAEYVS